MAEFTKGEAAYHEALGVVLQVREDALQVLLWQRAREPFAGAWSLPGGRLGADETLEESVRRHLAEKVDVRELSHLEQLETLSEPSRHPSMRLLATAYLGLVPAGVDPRVPADTVWHKIEALPELAFDHLAVVLVGQERLRAKLSYTNISFALAPSEFTIGRLRAIVSAALGYQVSATNLTRVMTRREMIEPTGTLAGPGQAGGRPAAYYRFRKRTLTVTDPFAVLKPPAR